jgi:DNA-binding response OmpR family regulator
MSDKTKTPLKILVADDDEAILRSARMALEKAGFAVKTARDGKEAYQDLQSDTFAAAIFDVAMPHIEGRDLVRYMQSEKRLMKIPVIIMTADLKARLSSESLSAGAVAFLPKPFTDAQLMTTLGMFVRTDGARAAEAEAE